MNEQLHTMIICYVTIRYAWKYVDSLWCPWSHKSIVTISFVMRWQCNMCSKVYSAVYYFTPRGFSKDSWVIAGWCMTRIARFMGPTRGSSGADRTQVGPMLAPRTLLSGDTSINVQNVTNAWGRLCLLTRHILHSVRRHVPYCDWWLSWQRLNALMVVSRLYYSAIQKHVLPSVHYSDVNMNICIIPE